MFGTVDSWLLWKLTGEHLTDVSNASRTLLLDLKKVAWSTELCKFFDIPMQILPRICSSAEVYAHFNDGMCFILLISEYDMQISIFENEQNIRINDR